MPGIGTPTAPRTPLAERVFKLLGSDSKLTLDEIDIIVEARYEHMCDTFDWPQRERATHLVNTIGLISSTATTTATVTNASPTVTFAGTPMVSSYGGKQIRFGTEPISYFIKFITTSSIELYSDPDLLNQTVWARDSDSGIGWTIFQSLYDVSFDMAHILSVHGQFEIREFDGGFEQLNYRDSYRLATAEHPTHWLYYHFPQTSGVARRIELWPVCTTKRSFQCEYLKAATTGILDDTNIDVPVAPLVYFTAADACHLLHAKQGSSETMWENKALFFERLGGEMLKDYKVDAIERRQPPKQLGRRPHDFRSLRGTDFEITHDLGLL